MSVFKIVGKVIRVLEGGVVREDWTKEYVRADNDQEASLLAVEHGFVDFKVKFFCPNYSADLGNITAYSADNGLGIAQGF